MRYRLRLLRWPVALDVGLAAFLAMLSLLAVWRLVGSAGTNAGTLGAEFGSPQSLHWRAAGWLAAMCLELGALPARRRFPLAVFAVTLGMTLAHSLLLPSTPAPADLAVAIAVYTVASARSRPVSAGATVAGLLLAAGFGRLLLAMEASSTDGHKALAASWQVRPTGMVVTAVVLAAAWLAGDGSKNRRAYIAEVERRAADAERDLGRQAELAAAAERERITRELHDVIAHALGVMVIQAQGAGSALRRRQEAETNEALDAIITTGRTALAETRRVLGIVRRPVGAEPERAPQPGLDGVAALAARVGRAGTAVQVQVTGAVRRLADAIELSAYRIVQEALTNTMKHSGPGACAVVQVQYIRAGSAAPKVLILTTFDMDEYVYAGLRAGASGFLLKDALAPELISGVRAVASGEAVVAPTVTRRLIERFIGDEPEYGRPSLAALDVLTAREREVLTLIARGLANAEIAQLLFLSEGTVKTHVSRVLAKLDLRDRLQAVILAYEAGLIRIGQGSA